MELTLDVYNAELPRDMTLEWRSSDGVATEVRLGPVAEGKDRVRRLQTAYQGTGQFTHRGLVWAPPERQRQGIPEKTGEATCETHRGPVNTLDDLEGVFQDLAILRDLLTVAQRRWVYFWPTSRWLEDIGDPELTPNDRGNCYGTPLVTPGHLLTFLRGGLSDDRRALYESYDLELVVPRWLQSLRKGEYLQDQALFAWVALEALAHAHMARVGSRSSAGEEVGKAIHDALRQALERQIQCKGLSSEQANSLRSKLGQLKKPSIKAEVKQLLDDLEVTYDNDSIDDAYDARCGTVHPVPGRDVLPEDVEERHGAFWPRCVEHTQWVVEAALLTLLIPAGDAVLVAHGKKNGGWNRYQWCRDPIDSVDSA